jgi:5-methylcytosine-specific restriction protein A
VVHREGIVSSAANTAYNPMRAGWLRQQPAKTGRALSEDFDGTALNPFGVEIDLPFWVFKQLKKKHLLEPDRETGKRRICERVFGLMELWDGPDFRPDRKFRAFDPRYQQARPRHSGYSSSFLKALGRDCSGLAEDPKCEKHKSQSYELQRGSSAKRGYGAKWQRLRQVILSRDNYICAACIRMATDVDHILPRSKGGMHDPDNLQSLCHECHSRKTGWTGDDGKPKTQFLTADGRCRGAGKNKNGKSTYTAGPCSTTFRFIPTGGQNGPF